MTKGKLTPLALAIGFALSGPILGAEVTGPYIHSSQTFDEDTVYTVTNTVAVIGSDYTNPVEITIGAGKTLTLQNSYVNTQTKILDGTYRGGLTFTGGNLVLRMDDTSISTTTLDDGTVVPYTEQWFFRATNYENTGTTTFNTDSPVLMEGSVPEGVAYHGKVFFNSGLVMNIDRSGVDVARDIMAVLGQIGGTFSATSAEINITAGANDTTIGAFRLGYGANLEVGSLNLQLNGNNAESMTEVEGLYVWDHKNYPQYTAYGKDIAITGPVTIAISKAPQATAYALDLVSKRNYSFGDQMSISIHDTNHAYGLYTDQTVGFSGDLTMDFADNNAAWGIFGYNDAHVTAKTATITMKGDYTTGVRLHGTSIATISDSLTTDAKDALFGQDSSEIDIQKDFITTAESSLAAKNDAQIRINSTGAGKVQFSGFTEITDNGQISLTVGSGAAGEDSYWNVTDFSALTGLTVAANASLNFLLTPELLGNLAADGAIVTVTGTPVLLHSATQGASTITLTGTGLALNAGDEVRLINSEKGIALDEVNNLLAAGDSLDELKGDLKVEHIASLSRVQESDLTKDNYDLLMKSDQMLVATIKEKRPSSDKVNDQTNALMQSSIASAATMYAADELLIDSTMKSRQGVRQTGPFAAARVGKYDLDVTGDADTTVISGLLGYAFNVQDSEVGIFMEMGHGTYDTRTATTAPVGETKGDGKHNYVGFGVYGNYATPIDWLHVTGYVKGGWLRNEFSAPIAGVSVDFDRTSNYWGAHLGMYGEFQAAGKIKNRTFLNYFYDGRESESYTASGSSDVAGADFHFNSLNSHRAQLGSVFEYAYTSALRPYAALTYEYAFKADAKGRASDQFGDLGLNGTDLEGSTGIVSLGWTYQNEAKHFEFDLGVNGYTGKRQGVSAQLQAAWKF